MGVVGSICSGCGLITITLKRLPKGVGCIKCADHLETLRAANVEALWQLIAADPPRPYLDPSDRDLLQVRFTKARERFGERGRQREEDKKLSPEWQSAAYFARQGLSYSAATRRSRRRRYRVKK